MSTEQERLPEGTECRFIARSSREDELLQYHMSYRTGLRDGMRLTIYEDYGYTSPDYVGWYFVKDDRNETYMVHYEEIDLFDNSIIDWLENLSFVR